MYEIITQWIRNNRWDLRIWFEKAWWDYKRNDLFITRVSIATDLNKLQAEKFFFPLLEFHIWGKLTKVKKNKNTWLNIFLLEVWEFIQ